jgi:hypothetical protein
MYDMVKVTHCKLARARVLHGVPGEAETVLNRKGSCGSRETSLAVRQHTALFYIEERQNGDRGGGSRSGFAILPPIINQVGGYVQGLETLKTLRSRQYHWEMESNFSGLSTQQ